MSEVEEVKVQIRNELVVEAFATIAEYLTSQQLTNSEVVVVTCTLIHTLIVSHSDANIEDKEVYAKSLNLYMQDLVNNIGIIEHVNNLASDLIKKRQEEREKRIEREDNVH